MRYRLRFLLQEFDLDQDEVVIGRGSDCTVTIDDPMMSREHLRIVLSGDAPRVEDLHSRNGTLLNGRAMGGAAPLEDGDRLRIGTQELVFVSCGRERREARTTGALTFCSGCAIPYPTGSASCPHCGIAANDQGVTTSVRDVAASSWTFHLLSQVVERAIAQNRLADAERMMSRGVAELEEQLTEGHDVDASRVVRLAECAARLGCALNATRWLEVSLGLYEHALEQPSDEVLECLLALSNEPELQEAVEALRHAADPSGGDSRDRPSRRAG